MSQIIPEIVSLPASLDCQTNLESKSIESGKGSEKFFTLIQKLMNPVQKKSFHGPKMPLWGRAHSKKSTTSILSPFEKGFWERKRR